jgi:hypothetical protein
VFSTNIVDHGDRRGNAMQALAQWRHPLASREALIVLHRVMRPALHRRIRMVVEIVVDLPAFFVASISLLATTMLKTMLLF